MDTKVKGSFWQDPIVDSLPPNGKLAILWLFTSGISACGWNPTTKRRFEFETQSPYQALLDAVKALGDSIVSHPKGLWVRKYIRHQIGDGERLAKNNMRFPVLRAMEDAPDEIRKAIAVEYVCLREGLRKPSRSGAPPQERSGKEKKGKEGSAEGRETDEEWLATLKQLPAYVGIDIERELSKAQAWGIEHRRKCSRRFFVNWLNRAEHPMTSNGADNRPAHRKY